MTSRNTVQDATEDMRCDGCVRDDLGFCRFCGRDMLSVQLRRPADPFAGIPQPDEPRF